MNQPNDPESLTELVARIRDHTRNQDRVSVGDLMTAVGERSFGPLVLLAGLVTVAPLIGDIPGVPTLLGLLVLLTLGQLLFQRRSVWIPSRLSNRHISKQTLFKGLQWADKPAAFVDHWTRRRLPWLVSLGWPVSDGTDLHGGGRCHADDGTYPLQCQWRWPGTDGVRAVHCRPGRAAGSGCHRH